MKLRRILHVVSIAVVMGGLNTACGQAPASPPDVEPINVGDTNVGYIDSAIPGTQFRVRADAAYGSNRPTRAEFFYARGAPLGPGLPAPETTVDYQDISTYLELALDGSTSIFGELPLRFINPVVNDNSAGLGDTSFGFKRAIHCDSDCVLSFQFKVFAPTGDADRGLGNHHASLEPGLLLYKRLDSSWAFEGELRYWIPIDGSEGFEGELIRYGVGASYRCVHGCTLSITPVVEFVGWTVLSGKVAVSHSPGSTLIEDAAGDTIVNAKLGVRIGLSSSHQMYIGYGRALTGEQWYDDVFRIEYRVSF